MNKDSLEMTDEDRAEVRDRVAGLLAEGAPIVISHGTDTMVETGRFLEKSLPDLKVPIVLTGAMTPLGFEGSDGLQNLDGEPACRAARRARRVYRDARTGFPRQPKCARIRTRPRLCGRERLESGSVGRKPFCNRVGLPAIE